MINRKLILALVSTSLMVTACSKKPPITFTELTEVLEPTETTLQDRDVQWFQDQELIRKKVISVCFDYLSEKAQTLGGEYLNEFNNDVFGKYAEFPDCKNARTADIQAASANAMVYEHEILNAESQLATPANQEYINQIAKDVAEKLDGLNSSNEQVTREVNQALEKIE